MKVYRIKQMSLILSELLQLSKKKKNLCQTRSFYDPNALTLVEQIIHQYRICFMQNTSFGNVYKKHYYP